MMTKNRAKRALAALCAAAALAAGEAAAQERREVVAGPQYRAGGLREMLLGENYRPVWTTPVRIEVLNPDTFAGGLTVEREGGGLSTESLRLKGRNGREYVFRSVDKDVTPSMHEDLKGTIPHRVVQDLVSAKHPAAALVVPPLLDAVGVLHATPRLFVMPDHAFLGEHRQTFAGRLGQLEERPTDGFARAEDVEGSEDFRKEIEDDPEDRVDSRAFLTARLMDVYLGDWDRHWDQWRWARYDAAGGLKVWRPIPRDRDNALNKTEGLIPAIGRSFVPVLTKFGPRYDRVIRYAQHPAELDRRLLSDLPRPVWDSTAAYIRAHLTDAVIDNAVRRLPPEYQRQGGAELAAALRARRDALPEIAADFYALLAREVNVHATDEDDTAEITRLADGSVDVVIRTKDDRAGEPYFRRRFLPAETHDVRVFLHGGDDRATVRGASEGDAVLVRVIGGGGDDRLADESRAGGGRTVLYDDRGENQLSPGREAKVDTREYETPRPASLMGNAPPPRDWGTSGSMFTPYATWMLNVGPVLGVGPTFTRYGFRRHPFAERWSAQVLYAPLEQGFGAQVRYDRRHTNRPSWTWLTARATNFEVVRFHGFGNDTPEDPDRDAFEVDQTQVRAQAAYAVQATRRLSFYAGPVAKWTDPELPAIAPAPLGTGGAFAQYGGEAGAVWDARDSRMYPRNGAMLRATAAGYGWQEGDPFGRVDGEAAGYLSIPGKMGPTLAVRAGGQLALGEFPFQESAFLGATNLRGYAFQRFRGDAAVYGSAELRARLFRANLGVVRADVGAFGLADAGRVYVDGDSPGDWHTAWGGGLWFEALDRVVSVTYARGETGSLYFALGMPF